MRRLLVFTLVLIASVTTPAFAQGPARQPTAQGHGGAVASVDPYASRVAIDVLRRGGNAVDAAVAAAAVLGVVEPYSGGIGGGGFMVIHTARGKQVTIDGRETAPARFPKDAFIDPATGAPYSSDRFGELVTSGLAVGVPGTPRSWELALRRYGTQSFRRLLRPAIDLARHGFVVDQTFSEQTQANAERFRDFPATAALFLDAAGNAPAPGTRLTNRDLARTYELMTRKGADAINRGDVARDIARAVQRPPVREGAQRNVRPGFMSEKDLKRYKAKRRKPTRSGYRGFEIVGMGPPSSGGSTVGEALNILEGFTPVGSTREQALHRYLEASRLSFADRGAFLGDADFVKVPLRGLLSDGFAGERRALIGEGAMANPAAAGNPWPYENGGAAAHDDRGGDDDHEGRSTTHLTVADREGNVVSYTFTIEQTGGSAIVVPGRGFLLNNELTDFDFATGRANSAAPGKRPRSSMSPTIVLRKGRPLLALGSPGGSTIITTVLQILVERLDLGARLPQALAAPRLSQRNAAGTQAEPDFLGTPDAEALKARGHAFAATPEIGAATAIELRSRGRFIAAAEPRRRGGGSAMVVR